MKLIWNRRLWRSLAVILLAAAIIGGVFVADWRQTHRPPVTIPTNQQLALATTVLGQLSVRPAAPKTGYDRKKFSDGWAKVDECTVRDKILARDMTAVRYRSPTDCTVISGTLDDPYTGKIIHFVRGPTTSAAVQIDHVVAISDAWQTGAQLLSASQRQQLYNDSLELLAVDGPANEEKGDGDTAAWLPSNGTYVCPYVARQIAVKHKYHLWVTAPEHRAMQKVLRTCPNQLLPATRS